MSKFKYVQIGYSGRKSCNKNEFECSQNRMLQNSPSSIAIDFVQSKSWDYGACI